MDVWGLIASVLAFLMSRGIATFCIGGMSLAAFIYQLKTLEVISDKLKILNEGSYLNYLNEASRIAFNLLVLSLGEMYIKVRETNMETSKWEEIKEDLKRGERGFPEELRAALERQYGALRFLEGLRDSIADLRSFHDDLRRKLYAYFVLALVISLLPSFLSDNIVTDLMFGLLLGSIVTALIAGIGDSQRKKELWELVNRLNHLFNMRSGEEVYNYALRNAR